MAKKKFNIWDKVSMTLTAVGGINWGLVGIGSFLGTNLNLVNLILGGLPVLENLVYIGVGVSASYLVWKTFN